MSNTATKPKPNLDASLASPGVIEPQSLYTLEELKRRLGFGNWAIRQMRRAGLVIYRVGGRGFALGRDVIDFIQSHGRDAPANVESNNLASELSETAVDVTDSAAN